MEINKETLSKNLVKYRKANNLTQSELAEKINYSDKAVSKWERGEGVPDVFVLANISEVLSVTIDKLIKEDPEKKAKVKSKKHLEIKRLIITSLAVVIAWLVAVIAFVPCKIWLKDNEKLYTIFIIAIPISAIITLVFSSIWHRKWLQFLSISTIIWSVLLVIYLLLLEYYYVFLIGIPLQILALFWYLYKKL